MRSSTPSSAARGLSSYASAEKLVVSNPSSSKVHYLRWAPAQNDIPSLQCDKTRSYPDGVHAKRTAVSLREAKMEYNVLIRPSGARSQHMTMRETSRGAL